MKRAPALWLMKRVALDEAAYLVQDKIPGADYDGSLALIVEAVVSGDLVAEVKPDIDPNTGAKISPVDASKSSVAVADLAAWIDSLPAAQVTTGKPRADVELKLTPVKKSVLLKELAGYDKLADAIQANEPEFKECRTLPDDAPGKKGGYYYLEKVEAICRSKWGDAKPELLSGHMLGAPKAAVVRGMRNHKKF